MSSPVSFPASNTICIASNIVRESVLAHREIVKEIVVLSRIDNTMRDVGGPAICHHNHTQTIR